MWRMVLTSAASITKSLLNGVLVGRELQVSDAGESIRVAFLHGSAMHLDGCPAQHFILPIASGKSLIVHFVPAAAIVQLLLSVAT
jgi:hypothetical protein